MIFNFYAKKFFSKLFLDCDREMAKMILLRAGDEFCNLAKTELDLVADYKKKLQDEKCVIWKRLHPKVREMCDVCSTSLFNAHFTCTECGIIVCMDCHQVRLKGNLAYQGSATSVTYKSRKRLYRKDFDSHYWPFCKEQGNEHQPEKLILTQIICGDILKETAEKVHETKTRLNMSLDCNCCKSIKPPAAAVKVVEVQQPDEIQQNNTLEKDIIKKEVIPVNKFISNLKECPVCKQSLKNDKKPLLAGVHLVSHFNKELNQMLPKEKPFKCPQCDQESPDSMSLMLHLGLDHDEFEKQVALYHKRKMTIKNIILKVDQQER